MMAWNAVVKYHGPKPTPGPNKIWVSNHTSMIDYCILCAHSPFAVIMQLQTGWVRFLQTRVLNSLGCLWFNRTDLKVSPTIGMMVMEKTESGWTSAWATWHCIPAALGMCAAARASRQADGRLKPCRGPELLWRSPPLCRTGTSWRRA